MSTVLTARPSVSPSQLPSYVTTAKSTPQPSEVFFTGEWVTILQGQNVPLRRIDVVRDSVWTCGVNDLAENKLNCLILDASYGIPKTAFSFQWTSLTSVLQTKDLTRLIITGQTIENNSALADVASCDTQGAKLTCSAKSLGDTSFVSGTYVPFVDKWIYVGFKKLTYTSISVLDAFAGQVRSYVYTSAALSLISLLHVQSPPVFIGGFVAGTCVSTAGNNCIYTGMVRTDSGIMTGMYLTLMKGSILNNAELVNAMALDSINPDSFIGGGLQRSDSATMQAYLVCVNSLYRRVVYSMSYRVHNPVNVNRRLFLAGYEVTASSAVKSMVLKGKYIFLAVNVNSPGSLDTQNSVSVLKTDMATGSIAQQVHIYSNNASVQCSDISVADLFLIMACAVRYSGDHIKTVVLSVNPELTFSELPDGFIRLEQDVFTAEKVALKGILTSLTMRNDNRKTMDYSFNTAELHPTIQPSAIPAHSQSSEPSSRPSSSPTASPSVSPQPTSQPSTSGPTNTYKPTIKPTQRPTACPTAQPSSLIVRSLLPTLRYGDSPSAKPTTSIQTNQLFSAKPTRDPTFRSTRTPTTDATNISTLQKERKMYRERESMILGQVSAGLVILWCLYYLCKWWNYKVRKVKEDNKRMKEMLAQDLPGVPRYPIFSAIIGLCYITDVGVAKETSSKDKAISITIASEKGDFGACTTDVDPESKIPQNVDNSTPTKKKKMKTEKETATVDEELLQKLQQNALTSLAVVNVELGNMAVVDVNADEQMEDVSDLSDASCVSEESADDSDSQSDDVDVVLSEESLSSRHDSWEFELGDDDDEDVVYTISSEDDDNLSDANQSSDDNRETDECEQSNGK